MRLDRRTTMKLGLGGAAALASPGIMTRAAQAQVGAAPTDNPGYHHLELGDFTLTSVQDGKRPGDGPHPIFGEDQSAEAVAELMEENFLPADSFVNGFTPVLVRTGDDLVLFDTGLGAGARANGLGLLRERMQVAGYAPEDVTVVVITHMHGDHVGGLIEDGEPAFANARHVTGQAEFDHWVRDGASDNEAVAASVVPLADRFELLEDGGEVVPGITAMLAAGHTPGHMIYRLESAGRQLLLTADTANHYVASLQRPDWHVRFDMDKEAAAQTRRRVFDMIATDRLPFIGYHMPFPSVGFAERLDTGYRFVPASYQFDL